jgi:hypothetical protein
MRKREHSTSPNPQPTARGALLLAELVPVAKARAAEIEEDWAARFEGEALAMAPYCHIDNLAAVELDETEDGWRTAVVLKQYPPQGDRLRSPQDKPFADRDDAMEYAINLMVMMIKIQAFDRGLGASIAYQDTHMWFRLHGQWIGLPASTHVATRQLAAQDRRNRDDVLRDLRLALRSAMPTGFHVETFQQLPDSARSKVMALVNLALHRGVAAFPQESAAETPIPVFDGNLGDPGSPGPGTSAPSNWLN